MINTLWIAGAVVLFLSLVIALQGFKPLPAGGRRCRRCGYDLSATPDDHRRCPECGRSLVGGVVEASTSESTIRWSRRLRRVGMFGIGLATLTAIGAGLFDPRRLPHTPGIWLLNIDVPLALRSPDPVADPVMREVLDRRRPGASDRIGDRDLESVARAVISRFDRPRHGGAGAREIVIVAWNAGFITDEEFLALDWITPGIELRFPGRARTDAVRYEMFGKVTFVAPTTNPRTGSTGSAMFSFELRPRRLGFGGDPEWRDIGGSMMGSRVDPHGGGGALSLGGLVRPDADESFPAGETIFNLEVDLVLVVDSNGRRLKKPPTTMRLSAPLVIQERSPIRVSMDVSEESCRKLREDLGSSSWYELHGPEADDGGRRRGILTVHIGLQETDRHSLGTPILRIEATVDGKTVSRMVDLETSAWPADPTLKLKVRFPGDRRILSRFATVSIGDLEPFESVTDVRLMVDTRTFDPMLFDRLTRSIMPGMDISTVNPIGCDFSIDLPELDPGDVEPILQSRGRMMIMDSILELETDTVGTPPDRNEP